MLFITRDGGYKQFALVQQRALGKPFQFTQKVLTKGMALQEAAEIVINEIMADQNIRDFSLIEKAPAQVADNQAFRLVFVYMMRTGLHSKRSTMGSSTATCSITSATPPPRRSSFKRICRHSSRC